MEDMLKSLMHIEFHYGYWISCPASQSHFTYGDESGELGTAPSLDAAWEKVKEAYRDN